MRSLGFFPTLILLLTLATSSLAQSWSEITAAAGPAPTARRHAGSAYDAAGHRLLIFGGQGAGGYVNDIWAFDLTTSTWTELTPGSGDAPSARRTPPMEYDPVSHQLLTWSGQGPGSVFFNDTWSFDLTSNTWTEFTPSAPLPAVRYGVGTAFDPIDRDFVTFAGFTFQGRFDDTWRFSVDDDTWTDVTPAGISPLERCLHSGVYDGAEHRLVIYGGQNGGALDDLWAFDLTTETWEDLTPAVRPAGRFFNAHVYDSQNHRSVIFGGTGSSGRTDEVWLFDLTTNEWEELMPSGTGPTPREGPTGIYIASEDRMIIYGGWDGSTFQSQIWSLNDLSLTPSSTQAPRFAAARLLGNAPNPFNPRTEIRFELARSTEVRLAIHDLQGRRVRLLESGQWEAGTHATTWHGRNDMGDVVASGTYVVKLAAAGTLTSSKVSLLK